MIDRPSFQVAAAVLLVALASPAGSSAARFSLDDVLRMIEGGQLRPAEDALRRILTEGDPPAARDLLGVVLSRQGRFDEAESEFLAALRADPDFLDARQHLARLYFLGGRDDEALAELRRAAELGPLERDLAARLALAEAAADAPAAAERQWRSLADRFGSVRALLDLATSRSRQRDPRGAVEVLREALEIAPNSEDLLRAYARAAFEAGEYVTTIVALEPLTRIHPEVAEYAYLMGVARMQVGDTAGAVEALRQARRLDPRRSVTLIALGMALNLQKFFAEARATLLDSLRLEPDNVEALAALAEAEEGLAELDAALEHASRALAQEPSHATANLVLGTLRMKQGRYTEARDALRRAVDADPDSLKAHYQLSLAYARLDDPESSKRHLEIYRNALRELEESRRELTP